VSNGCDAVLFEKLQTYKKSKATLVTTGLGDLQSFEMLRNPHSLDNGHKNEGEVVNRTRRPRFSPLEESCQ
jgi:hypothetical protein